VQIFRILAFNLPSMGLSATALLCLFSVFALASAGSKPVSEARVEEDGALGGLLASEVDTEFKVCYAPKSVDGAATPSTLKLNDLKGKVVVLQSSPSNCPAVYDQMPAYSLYAAEMKKDPELAGKVEFLTSLWYTHSEADCQSLAEGSLSGPSANAHLSLVEAAVEKAEALPAGPEQMASAVAAAAASEKTAAAIEPAVTILDDGANSPSGMSLLKLLGPGRPQFLVLDPRDPSSVMARFGVPPEMNGYAPTGMNFSAFDKAALDKEVRRAAMYL